MGEGTSPGVRRQVSIALAATATGVLSYFVVAFVARVASEPFDTPCHPRDESDVISITGAIEQYVIENNGRYPAELRALVVPDEHGLTFLGQESVPLDPWGNPYVYEPPEPGTHDFRVASYGSDGLPGGTGDARDIDNIMIRNGDI